MTHRIPFEREGLDQVAEHQTRVAGIEEEEIEANKGQDAADGIWQIG